MKLQSVILFLVTIFFFYSCEKEYSVENGGAATGGGTVGGNAIYTLDGGTGACTNAAVSGTYTAGTILSAANTITLQVEVDSIGTYIVSSSSANGIVFNGTGAFTALGPQTITLRGSGTPTDAGTFTFLLGTSGCSFSVTVTGAITTPAVFSFNGGTGACPSAIVSGTFTAGTAVTAANTVTVQVNVDSIGIYAVSTSSVNGLSFSASGSFTFTGVQTITLTGAGTPASAGTYDFTPAAGACTYSVIVDDGTVSAGLLFYDITVNGVQYKEVADSASGYGFETDISGTDSVALLSGISYYNTPEPLGATRFVIGKGLLYNYSSATFTDFKNFFAPGSFSYAAPGSLNGITIEWKDPNNKIWKSNNAPGTQTGSNFTINSSEEFIFIGVTMVKVDAVFNCTLYDDAGNSIVVTNGKYLGAFEQL